MDHDHTCDAAAEAIRRMAADVSGVDMAMSVPTCPGWDVRRLVAHVGAIHRWAAGMVAAQSPVRLDRVEGLDVVGVPAEWLAAGADLVSGMRATPGDTPMWAWGADRHARFWPRRMLHETGVHHADLRLALGRDSGLDPAWAADGIDELLENLPHAAYFAPGVADLRGEGSIHVHSIDSEGEWMIELEPEGFAWKHAHGKATTAVRGTAGDLLALMYGRLVWDDARFETFGDTELLGRWLRDSAL